MGFESFNALPQESQEKKLEAKPPVEISPSEFFESLDRQSSEIEVPPQYKGMDADTLEFAWTIPEYVDPEKTKNEKARKQKVIAMLRQKEANTEGIASGVGGESDDTGEAQEKVESPAGTEQLEHQAVVDLVEQVSQGRK